MAGNKFHDTDALSIFNTFKEQDQIVVPHFQRDYSWNTDSGDNTQVLDLWSDIAAKYYEYRQSNNKKDLEYLLGPMIFIKKDNSVSDIVDGQQRLSTLTMLLCIARDILHEFCMDNPEISAAKKPHEKHYEMIENLEFQDYDDETKLNDITFAHDSWKLTMNKNDKEFFETFVQQYKLDSEDTYEKNSKDQFRRISKKIEYYKCHDEDTKKLSPSNLKIYRAYVFLYEKLNDALLTGFNFELEADDVRATAKKENEKNFVKKARKNPSEYGFSDDFFNNPNSGYDVLVSSEWTADNKILKLAEHKKSNSTLDFEIWIDRQRQKKYEEENSKNCSLKSFTDNTDELLYLKRKESLSNLKKFIEKIFEHFCNVRIGVDDDDDAFQIFETVNARGATLSKTNLIKNWILRSMHEKNQSLYATKWDSYLKDIDDKHKDEFFIDSIRSRGYKLGKETIFGKYKIYGLPKLVKLSKDNIYKIIKNPFQELDGNDDNKVLVDKKNEQPKSLVDKKNELAKSFVDNQLQHDIKIYQTLKKLDNIAELFPEKPGYGDITTCLIDLVDLNATYVHIILMTAHRKWEYTVEFTILTKLLTMFFIRFKSLGTGTGGSVEKIMFIICTQIQNTDEPKVALTNIIKILSSYDKENVFKNFLTRTEIKDDTGKFILKHIAIFLEPGHSDTVVKAGLELEHILPQNPREKRDEQSWNKDTFFAGYGDLDTDYGKSFSAWHLRLGNLTLLDHTINNIAKNYNYATKLSGKSLGKRDEFTGYKKSRTDLNKYTLINRPTETSIDWTKPITELEERTDWTVKDIHDRTLWLYEISSLIWKLPSIKCSDQDCPNHKESMSAPSKLINKIDTWRCDICDNSLIIEWSKTVDVAYQIPDDYKFS